MHRVFDEWNTGQTQVKTPSLTTVTDVKPTPPPAVKPTGKSETLPAGHVYTVVGEQDTEGSFRRLTLWISAEDLVIPHQKQCFRVHKGESLKDCLAFLGGNLPMLDNNPQRDVLMKDMAVYDMVASVQSQKEIDSCTLTTQVGPVSM